MSLNRSVFLLISIILFTAYGCSEDKQSTFSITGKITNPQNGSVILSQLEDINRKKTRVIGELNVANDGSFGQSFDLEPHIYTINFYDRQTITLAIDKGQKISIKVDGNDLKNIEISGSEDTDKLLEYEKFRNESLDRLVKSVRSDLQKLESENNPNNKDEIEKLGIAEIENYEKHRDELNTFIKNKMTNSVAIYPTTLRWDGDENIDFYENLASSFESAHPNLDITKRINEKVEILKNTSIGGKSFEIKMPDENGQEISLSTLKGKYILIDFWASWCGPCRRESGIVAELYDKYKNEGFEIYGVSLDSEKGDWLNAIEKDKRIWTNVSTLQGFETPATFEYAVTALPAKFLIDADGKIVAKNLHGKDLKEKLDKLFSE